MKLFENVKQNKKTEYTSYGFLKFLANQTDCKYNYDCINCPESDCIVPADEDTIQGRLF